MKNAIEKIEVIYRGKGDDPLADPLGIGDERRLSCTETIGVKISTSDGKQYGNYVANYMEPMKSRELVNAINILLESITVEEGE